MPESAQAYPDGAEWSIPLAAGKEYFEAGALSFGTFDLDATPVVGNNVATNGQSQARAELISGIIGGFGAEKRLKNPGDVVRVDAQAGVADGYANQGAVIELIG